jgi:hypothetical protein
VLASNSHVTHSHVQSRVPPYSHAASTMFASKNQRAASKGISVKLTMDQN